MAGLIGTLRTIWNYALARRNFTRWPDRRTLEAWQDRQVRAHLQRILPQSAFYRERYAGLDLHNWRDFPVIEKRDMMEHFDTLNTAGLRRDEAFASALHAEESRDFRPVLRSITVGLSSGTSGSRGLFLASNAERQRWAGTMLARILPVGLRRNHRAALLLRANSNLYENIAGRRLAFRFFDLFSPWDTLAENLASFAPTLLVAPPSALLRLADSRKWKPVERVVAAAEVLEPQDAEKIADAFHCGHLHQIYQATEGFIAATCEHGTLHLNEDIIAVQREDLGRGRFVPILTDFRRTTQPILRYRLNDILRLREKPCACGSVFTAIETVEGRCDDTLTAPALSDGRPVEIFADFIRRAFLTAHTAISEYALTQRGQAWEASFIAPAVENCAVRAALTTALQNVCARFGAHCPPLAFTAYSPPRAGEKLRRIRRASAPKL